MDAIPNPSENQDDPKTPTPPGVTPASNDPPAAALSETAPASATPPSGEPASEAPAVPDATASKTPSVPSETPAPSPAKPPSATDLAASFSDPADGSLDQAVAEAVQGLTEAELAGEGAPTPSPEAMTPDTVVSGRVANIGSEDILIDFDGKSLGTMQLSDLAKGESFEVGDTLEVLILGEDPHGGLLRVSYKKAKQAVILRDLAVGQVLEGRVAGMNKGGLEVDIQGLRAFIPASQVDLHFVKDISDLIGQTVRAEVTKFDRHDDNIVLSRRKVQVREQAQRKEQLFAELQPGQVRRGVVRSLADFGAFVDIGGAEGLLHISDMSWGRIAKPDEVVKVGDEIDVKILKINPEKKRLSLGLKQTVSSPWEKVDEKYSTGIKTTGRVVRLTSFGAFVELEPGLDGLLPVSEMSWTRRIRHPSEIVKEGDMVEVAILSIEPEKKRISLSLKQLLDDPWVNAAEEHPAGTSLKGKVVRTTDFGAFVDLGNGIDGMIHISELANEHVKAVTDKVKAGDEVEVRVLGVDVEAKKVSLSMRPPPPEPTPEELAKQAAERAAAAKKKKSRPSRGGITFGWDEGLGSLDPSKFAR